MSTESGEREVKRSSDGSGLPPGLQIALIDDSRAFLSGLRELLLSHQCVVRAYLDGEVAIEKIRSEGADIVITDLEMEGLSGIELVRRLRSEHICDETRACDSALALNQQRLKLLRVSHLSGDAEAEPFEKVSPRKVIQDSVDFCRQRFRSHGIPLTVEDDLAEDLRIEARGVQLSQVLLNLLNNAHDAVEHLSQRWVKVLLLDDSDGDHIRILVRDSGGGIAEELRKRIFEPFFTTKGAEKGMGLGMTVVQRIIASHGGEIRVNPDCPNTEFVIRLPKRQPGSGPA